MKRVRWTLADVPDDRPRLRLIKTTPEPLNVELPSESGWAVIACVVFGIVLAVASAVFVRVFG